MDKMLGLLGKKSTAILFCQIFLEQMPEHVRSVLVHSEVTDYKKLAKAADSLYEAHRQTPAQLNKVSLKKPAANNNSKSQTNSEKPDNKQPRLCFYHKRWGNKAHRCVIPCTWEAGNTVAGSQ